MLLRLALLAALALVLPASAAPTPIDQAIPKNATEALFIERIGSDLTPTLDAFERAFGAEEAILFLEDAPLPALAVQVLVGLPREVVGVDPEGGLALYRAPGFKGAVGLVAVSDADAARNSLEQWFKELGTEPVRDTKGEVIVLMPDGQEIRSFVRGRFLYLVMPELEHSALPNLPDPEHLREDHAITGDPETVIPAPGTPGLRSDPDYAELRGGVRRGTVYLFLRTPFEAQLGLEAGVLSFEVTGARVEIDGVVAAPGGGFMRRPAPKQNGALDPLTRAPPGAVVIASARLTPEGLGLLLGGPPGSERRGMFESLLGELKLPAEALLKALDGNAWLRFHLDAKSLARNLRKDQDAAIGWFDVQLGIGERKPLAQALSAERLESSSGSQQRAWRLLPRSNTLRRRQSLDGDPVELRLLERRLELRYGLSGSRRPPRDVLAELRERFGPGAFGPGHVTLLVDVVELRTQLDEPVDTRGMSSPDQKALRMMMRAPFSQFFGMDYVFVDAFADGDLIRVRGEVRFVETETRSL